MDLIFNYDVSIHTAEGCTLHPKQTASSVRRRADYLRLNIIRFCLLNKGLNQLKVQI